MNDPVREFREALAGRGIVPPDDLIADGRIHRCDTEDRKGKSDASYLLHREGIPAGGFQNWRDGLGWQDWRVDTDRVPTPAEGTAHRARIESAQRQREVDQARRHEEVRRICALVWNQALPVDPEALHPYLIRKGVRSYGLQVTGNGRLLIPLYDSDGTLHSLQFINAEGNKRFKTSGRKHGCYFSIGQPKDVLCLAEGYATAASIHEATGHAVAVAFDAGNLLPVAQALREKMRKVKIILCADDDWKSEGNPGLTHATEAARAVGGLLAVPVFEGHRDPAWTDFNDLHQVQGLEAVARCIAAAGEPAKEEVPTGEENSPMDKSISRVNLIRGDTLQPEPIDWLWPGWLAAGKLHILAGEPGTGKTSIAMALAASITSGGRWPDGIHARRGRVAIWSGEDDPTDTLVPRLMASGADMSRVHFIGSVISLDGKRPFDPARDVEPLKRELLELGNVRLLIVDPIVSAITGDSHKNAEVRRGLQPLVDLAALMRCAILGITHFSKGTAGRDPAERVTGSLAFGALARVVLVAAKSKEESGDGRMVRILCRAKSNIGPDEDGFEYDLQQPELKAYPGIFASHVLWGNPVEGTARELLAEAEDTGDGEGGVLGDAKRFLTDLLVDGPMSTKDIQVEAKEACISWRTVERAKSALGIKSEKSDFSKGWRWLFPNHQSTNTVSVGGLREMETKTAKDHEERQQKKMADFRKFGGLWDEVTNTASIGGLDGLRISDEEIEVTV
ncbi:MAG: AAA family ATPase [Azoarcus sp.]|jgi:putative DNA primase/helicase|nr:AAA family ATPase [Azoarcus sp.]